MYTEDLPRLSKQHPRDESFHPRPLTTLSMGSLDRHVDQVKTPAPTGLTQQIRPRFFWGSMPRFVLPLVAYHEHSGYTRQMRGLAPVEPQRLMADRRIARTWDAHEGPLRHSD